MLSSALADLRSELVGMKPSGVDGDPVGLGLEWTMLRFVRSEVDLSSRVWSSTNNPRDIEVF